MNIISAQKIISAVFNRFPFRVITGAFVLLSLISYFLDFKQKAAVFFIITAVALLYLSLFIIRRVFCGKDFPRFFAYVLLLFSASVTAVAVSFIFFNVRVDTVHSYADRYKDEAVNVTAVVLNTDYEYEYGSRYEISIEKIGGEKVKNIKAQLSCDYGAYFSRRERFEMDVLLSDKPGGFSGEELSLVSDGIFLFAESAGDYISLGQARGTFISYFEELNLLLTDYLKFRIGDDEAALVSALLLGNRDGLADSLKRDMRRLGISHILAISGLHMTVLIGGFDYILIKMGIRRRIRDVFSVVIILFFMVLTGFSPSVMRCAIMNIGMRAAKNLNMHYDPITSLFLSISVILIFNPPSVVDIGLMLSFLATLGMMDRGAVWNRIISNMFKGRGIYLRFLRKIFLSLSSTAAAMIYTLPVMFIFFGEISLAAPIANLLFIPLTAILLIFSPFVIFTLPVSELCRLIIIPVKFIAHIFIGAAEFFARKADFTVSLRYDFVGYAAVITMIAAAAVYLIKKSGFLRGKTIYIISCFPFAAAVLSFCIFFGIYTAKIDNETQIFYRNTGKNDAIIAVHGGKCVVADVSDGSYGIAYECIETVRENHHDEIYAYIFTHLHARHVMTLSRLSDNIYLEKIFVPSPISDTDYSVFDALESLTHEKGIEMITYDRNDSTLINTGDIHISLPPYIADSRSTHPVITFTVRGAERNILYCGGSVFETDGADFALEAIRYSDTIIFGSHHPKTNNPITLELNDSQKCEIIFANREIADLVSVFPLSAAEIRIVE